MAVWETECPTQGFCSRNLSRAPRREAVVCSVVLLWRLGCCLSPGGEPRGGPPYLAHLCCSGSGRAPDCLGSVECSRGRDQNADSWNHWLGRMSPTSNGFLPPPCSASHAAGIWHFHGGGPRVCGWGNSRKEYDVYLLCFPFLTLMLLCRRSTLKWTLKSRMCAKICQQECSVIEKKWKTT